jgi:hypothetical protein
MADEPARPLNDDESRVLRFLLAQKFDGADELRRQADEARVVGRCRCGCPTIDLEVPENVLPSPIHTRLAPVEGKISPAGDEPPGEIIMFLDAGRLSSLEYVYYTDSPPPYWPPPSRLTAVVRPEL